MLVTDIVKPTPKTELEYWDQWKNNFKSQFLSRSSFSKKIEVRDENGTVCDWCGLPSHPFGVSCPLDPDPHKDYTDGGSDECFDAD